MLPAAKGVRYTPATLGGVAGEWVEAEAAAVPLGSPGGPARSEERV